MTPDPRCDPVNSHPWGTVPASSNDSSASLSLVEAASVKATASRKPLIASVSTVRENDNQARDDDSTRGEKQPSDPGGDIDAMFLAL